MQNNTSYITTHSVQRLQRVLRLTGLMVMGVWTVIFLTRLWWLQLHGGDQWQTQAESNRVIRTLQRAPRGRIIDRNDQVVADNQVVYTQRYQEDGQRKERIIPREEAVAQLATSPANVNKNFARVYPYGPVLSHIVGYIQQPLTSTDMVFGRMGIEYRYNQVLSGVDGATVYERNAHGAANRVLWEQAPEMGNDLKLTIDAELSAVAFAALGTQRGAVIMTQPKTGEVLVLVSKPSFLPYSELPENLEQDAWVPYWEEASQSATLDETWLTERGIAPSISAALDFAWSPFLFRPIAAVYPPGSVYKVVTALAGLEREVIDTSTTVLDEGELKVGEFTYQNWYWRQFGRVEGEIGVTRALARSNDIFFYKLAEWLSPEVLAEFSHWFSFGEKTGIALPGEQAGIVPTPAWKQRTFGERWYLGNTYHMGIGQGDVLVTPIQVNTMMSTLVTAGRQCTPRFVQSEQARCQEVSLSSESVAAVIEGLRGACSAGGTAYPFFTSSYDVICKTGTAEFGGEDERGYRHTHGWLTAAASRQPKQAADAAEFSADVVVTVLVESDDEQPYKEGSRDAGEVAKAVLDWWYVHRVGESGDSTGPTDSQ